MYSRIAASKSYLDAIMLQYQQTGRELQLQNEAHCIKGECWQGAASLQDPSEGFNEAPKYVSMPLDPHGAAMTAVLSGYSFLAHSP